MLPASSAQLSAIESVFDEAFEIISGDGKEENKFWKEIENGLVPKMKLHGQLLAMESEFKEAFETISEDKENGGEKVLEVETKGS